MQTSLCSGTYLHRKLYSQQTILPALDIDTAHSKKMSKSKSLGPLFCCCIFKVQFHGSQFARSTLEPRAASKHDSWENPRGLLSVSCGWLPTAKKLFTCHKACSSPSTTSAQRSVACKRCSHWILPCRWTLILCVSIIIHHMNYINVSNPML